MAKKVNWFALWQIDVIANGLSVKEAAANHGVSTAAAYAWLKKKPKLRAAYAATRAGRRIRWKEEKDRRWMGKERSTKNNPSTTRLKKARTHSERMAWADRAYRRALQERREWLWWLVMQNGGRESSYLKGLQKELKQIEKDLKEIGLNPRNWCNPSKGPSKNPDDSIRKLQRVAETTKEPADIAAYWHACLRAGIEPEPTFTHGMDHMGEKLLFDVWTLYPKKYDSWDSWLKQPPRILHDWWHDRLAEDGTMGRHADWWTLRMGTSNSEYFGPKKDVLLRLLNRLGTKEDARWAD